MGRRVAVVALLALGAATEPLTPKVCDIFATGGTPCVAAHSLTRALYASYDGPLCVQSTSPPHDE